MPSYEPDRARSATPGRVRVDDSVRDFFERRAQSLRYPQRQPDRPAYTNDTFQLRRRDFYPSERHNSQTADSFERDTPLPPPSLVQNASINPRASIRRTEMSLIANQEDDCATARGRAPPSEFYSNPANRFKSLPLPPKKKKEEQKEKNFLVKSYRWLKKTLLGKKTKTASDMRHMEPPRPPPSSHTRSYSLPRNTRFARNKSSRREPNLNPQPPPAPQLIPSTTLQRVPASRSSDFLPPLQQDPIHQPVRRSGSFHQAGDRRSLVAEEQLDDNMNPLQLGFPNLGNSCYWNAILQALGALEPIASYYLGRDTKRTRSNSDLVPAEECSLVFTKLIEAMWRNTDGGDYIKKLRAIFHKENINFGKACQEDAHEFLMCLINMLSKDAAGNECFDPATNAVGLDQGAFKANLKGYLKNDMYCCTCNYHPASRLFFTPFITLSFPEKTDATLSFKAINDTVAGRGRVVLHSVHVNSTAGMIAAHKLIAHETGISDSQVAEKWMNMGIPIIFQKMFYIILMEGSNTNSTLLLFQVSGITFSQTIIDEHDLVRNRFSKPDEVYATQLDPVSLVNGIEVVTVLFFHAEQHPEYGMRRITEPFKCVLPLNATYAEIVNAIKTASGPVFRQTNNPLLFANDILIVDDNEFEGRPLSRVSRNPLVHAQADRCMDEQTRILPNLPRFLRLVVRWKSASNIIYPRHDNIVAHPSYVEPTPSNYPVTLSLLFAKYFAAEYINDWSCERCKGKGAIRTTRYACAPNIIAVSCKRFRFMPNGTATKIETPVVFNLDNVNISQFVDDSTPAQQKMDKHSYDVVSFACHYGNTESGHYYCYARSPTTDQWRRYDDNIVNPKPQMNDTNAYVIFLQNHNDRMSRKRGMTTLLKETSIFQSLRPRRSGESLSRIPNGPPIATEEAPFRRGSDQQTPYMNGGFNRADVSRSSRQTHL